MSRFTRRDEPSATVSPTTCGPMVETLRQAAAISFCRRDGVVTFCLITTAAGDKWGVPKGVIEQGGTPIDTALKEAQEEAGLRGAVIGDKLGSYVHTKWGSTFMVDVYLMEVSQEDDDWQEKSLRQRRWCDGPTALRFVGRRPVGTVLRQAIRKLAQGAGDP